MTGSSSPTATCGSTPQPPAAGLGLGRGRLPQFNLDVAGAKVRLLGNAVYDQDSWLPEISVGTQFKAAGEHAVLHAIGAGSPDGVDFYVAATKLFLAQSLLVSGAVRATKANQLGILGFRRATATTATVPSSRAPQRCC